MLFPEERLASDLYSSGEQSLIPSSIPRLPRTFAPSKCRDMTLRLVVHAVHLIWTTAAEVEGSRREARPPGASPAWRASPQFSTSPTPIHRSCTISAPCDAPIQRLSSRSGAVRPEDYGRAGPNSAESPRPAKPGNPPRTRALPVLHSQIPGNERSTTFVASKYKMLWPSTLRHN